MRRGGSTVKERRHTLAGALDAAAGALEACEAGALEAVADLGAIVARLGRLGGWEYRVEERVSGSVG